MNASLNTPITKDTTKDLWEKLFLVKVPYSATLSETDINMFGTPTVLDKDMDRNIMRSLTTIMIPVVSIIEYYRKGVTVKIVNRDDVLTIYTAIQDHLEYWAKHVKTGLNVGSAPIADLILMDEFAHKLHSYTKGDLSDISLNCALSRQLDNIGFVDWSAVFGTNKTAEVITKTSTNTQEDDGRVKLSEVFKNAVIGLNNNGYR